MSRKREFDYDQALQRATLLFWKKGYSNTSLRELLKVMGIGEGSFYSLVKGKKDLYTRCLAHYNDTVSGRRLAALNSGANAKEGVRAFFKTVLDELDNPRVPRVCLLAGALSSDVLQEGDLKKIVVRDMHSFADCFTIRLNASKDAGELPHEFDADSTAQVIVAYLQGLFRILGVLYNRAEVERQIERLLGSLGL